MSVKIRLQRGGAKKRPYYSIVAATSTASRDGKFIEKLGTYNPVVDKTSPERLKLKKERIEYWLSTGAEPSERVALIISQAGVANDNPVLKKVLSRREVSKVARLTALEKKKKAEAEAKRLEEEKAQADASPATAETEAPKA